MGKSTNHVAVVGGGLIGGFTAWYLAQRGTQVTVIEGREFASGCSHGNCGYVCPSHLLPLAAPGAIRKTLPNLFRRNAPFKIRYRLSPALWSWFLQFARHCNSKDMRYAAAARHGLLNSSMQLYDEFIKTNQVNCEWESRGLLFVYRSQHEFDAYAETNRVLSNEFGVSAKPYTSVELTKLEPALKQGLGGAWHYEGDRHLRPDLLMSELKRLLKECGVAIVENSPISKLRIEGEQVVAAESGEDAWSADQFVFATGAATPLIQKELGCRLPIQPGKGYTITMPSPDRPPRIPMIFEEDRVAVTPFRSAYRIGSTMEFAGFDSSIPPRRLSLLTRAAARYLHTPYVEHQVEPWAGWRPMTPNGLPIIDRAPAANNLWIAAGHNMLGLSMAPATGKLVSELLLTDEPHLDPGPFQSLSRTS